MNTVTVKKEKLIETLTANRAEHRDQFEKAQVKFRERVIEELDKRLDRAKKGDRVKLTISLPEPRDYTDSYDTALAMLDWEIDDEVTLSQQQFNQLVLNNWDWAQAFAGSTQVYLAE